MMTTVMSELTITLNGDPRRVAAGSSVANLLASLDLPAEKVAVERNLAIVPRSTFAEVVLAEGDALEVVHFVGGGQDDGDTWVVAGRRFTSRLIVGTGTDTDYVQNPAPAEPSGPGTVTVEVGVCLRRRRVCGADRRGTGPYLGGGSSKGRGSYYRLARPGELWG